MKFLIVATCAALTLTAGPARAADNTCKDFPAVIYPSHTSLQCETGSGAPRRATAYIETKDSVEKVTEYYKTEVESAGWKVDKMEVEGPTRAVVTMRKGKGHATAVINKITTGSGSRIQVHAYPDGN